MSDSWNAQRERERRELPMGGEITAHWLHKSRQRELLGMDAMMREKGGSAYVVGDDANCARPIFVYKRSTR